MTLYVRLLVFIAIAGVSVPGFAEDVTIRLINVKDDRSLGNQTIVLFLGNPQLPSTQRLEAKTSPDGVAVVHLPVALPEKITVIVGNGKLHGCGSPVFSTREAIERGVVGDNKCDTNEDLKIEFIRKPGEVVIFVRFLKWWEKMQT